VTRELLLFGQINNARESLLRIQPEDGSKSGESRAGLPQLCRDLADRASSLWMIDRRGPHAYPTLRRRVAREMRAWEHPNLGDVFFVQWYLA
jgi:hypothetical protein